MISAQSACDKGAADGWPLWSILVVDDEQGMRNFLVKTLLWTEPQVPEAAAAPTNNGRPEAA